MSKGFKGASARISLLSGENVPSSSSLVLMLYRENVQFYKYFSFIKKHFIEIIYSLILGKEERVWAESVSFLLNFF